MERELVTSRATAQASGSATEVLIDVVRLDVKGVTSSLLEPGSSVALAADQKTPFAARRTLFPATRKMTDSVENRFVIYLTDPAASMRVRNALSNLIALCEARAG